MSASSQHVYIIKTREFISLKEDVYKIGKTTNTIERRFAQYPKGSRLEFAIACEDCSKLETELIQQFKKSFIHRKDLGNEYFGGKLNLMIECMYNTWYKLPCGKLLESEIKDDDKSISTLTLSHEEKFLIQFAKDYFDKDQLKLKNNEFYTLYKKWCSKNIIHPKSAIALGRDLKLCREKKWFTIFKNNSFQGKDMNLKLIRESFVKPPDVVSA